MSAAPDSHHRGAARTHEALTMILFLVGLGLGLAGAIAGAILPARLRVLGSAACSSGACVTTFVAAARVLASGQVVTFRTTEILPLTGINLTLDPLGALFLATTAVVGLAASCYSIGYAKHAMRSRT